MKKNCFYLSKGEEKEHAVSTDLNIWSPRTIKNQKE